MMRRNLAGVILAATVCAVLLATLAHAQGTPELVVPGCVNVDTIAVGRSYPITAIRTGSAQTIKRWSVAGEDGGVDITLRACSGTICGPTLGWWSQQGGGNDSSPLDYDPEPDVVLVGPMVLEALVRVKSGTTKGMIVCLE